MDDKMLRRYKDELSIICEEFGGEHPKIERHDGWISAQFYVNISNYNIAVDVIASEKEVQIKTGCYDLYGGDYEQVRRACEEYIKTNLVGTFSIGESDNINVVGIKEVSIESGDLIIRPFLDIMLKQTVTLSTAIGKQEQTGA